MIQQSHHRFEPHELDVLTSQYRLALEPGDDPSLSLVCRDLLQSEVSEPYLQRIAGEIFETDSMKANVSLFAKRYAYLTIAAGLFAMSRYNKALDLTLENCTLDSYRKGEAWLPRVLLHDRSVTMPEPGQRHMWRDELIRRMFADNLAKVWSALSQHTGVSKAVLWENTAIYVYWLYENSFAEEAEGEELERVKEDFHYLLHDAPAILFGERKNPLHTFNTPKRTTLVSETPIRVRKTCCLYYLAADEPDDYCPTCPKLKHGAVSC
ncbi:IucA/IucC family C-terminal-domain containing protein [Paenibacillus sp. WLX1005]|uniref:IucA/IucC family C-terminal-domain containing protein n=1 Tax=Paenibacillus sp. WLX1005 TaxID=3243766 RepID=UPI0039843EC1